MNILESTRKFYGKLYKEDLPKIKPLIEEASRNMDREIRDLEIEN
jgi:hypothetical protein